MLRHVTNPTIHSSIAGSGVSGYQRMEYSVGFYVFNTTNAWEFGGGWALCSCIVQLFIMYICTVDHPDAAPCKSRVQMSS